MLLLRAGCLASVRHGCKRLGACLLACGLFMGGQLTQAGVQPPDAAPDLYQDAMLSIVDGRLEDAEKALATLTETEPRHAGAWLDLAMLYCAAGNTAAAEKLFVEIERRFAPPPPILEVMAYQRKRGCAGPQTSQKATVRLGRGTESNVNQGAHNPNFTIGSGVNQIDLVLLPSYQPRSDQYNQLSGEWVSERSPYGATGVVQFQTRTYDQLTNFNSTSLFLGVERPWRWGNWGVRVAGSAGLMTLDNQLYVKQNQLQMEVVPPLPLPANWKFGVTGSWSMLDYPTLSGFDAQWWETRGALTYRKDNTWFQVSASAVQDRATGQRPGGDRVGMFGSVQGRMSLGNRVLGEAGWQLQSWQADGVFSPGLIDVRRAQNTSIFRLAATLPIDTQQAVILEFRDTQNYENISIFEYRNQAVQLSWQWNFFTPK